MKKNIREFIIINVGLMLISINVHFFLVPNSLAAGGITGLSVLANALVPSLSIGLIMLCMNVILFIIGFIFVGFSFGTKTILSSLSLSGYVYLFGLFFPVAGPLGEDILIQLFIGFSIAAFGMALVFSQNASTGGTDILAMILNKHISLSIGKAVLLCDVMIAASSSFLFGYEKGMYAVFGVFLNGVIIDYVLQQFNGHKEIVIISEKSDEIRGFIIKILGKGTTVHYAKGGYSNNRKEVITTILSKKDFSALKKFIFHTDPSAFITVNDAKEVYGTRIAPHST
ncbi:YitT family protein [Rossellomorea aquimaris]|nr:YitT family protein [Rossellomorea aquimaris]